MKNVLTRDLVLTIKNKFRIRLALKIVQLIRGLEDEFLTELLKILYDDEKNQLVVLGEKDIIPPLSEIVYRTDIPILSFDDVFSKELNSPLLFNIDTSRQIEDYDRRTFSVGPRFGAKDIFHQLQKVRRFIGDSRRTPIALYDLGIFSGGFTVETLSSVIAMDFDPKIVYASIIREVGLRRIMEELKETGIRLICLNDHYEGGWDELRDIIGIHGFTVNPRAVDFFPGCQTENTFIPYTEMIDWFSLPYNPRDTEELVDLCEKYRRKLATILVQELSIELKVVGRFQNRDVYSIFRQKEVPCYDTE